MNKLADVLLSKASPNQSKSSKEQNPLAILENKIFYKYKSKANQSMDAEEQDKEKQVSYSMMDILHMNQDEICQTVFMFDTKQGDLFES